MDDEIIAYIEKHLKPKRLKHTYAVAEEAVKLAERYGADPAKARTAALAHDMFRNADTQVMDAYIDRYGLSKKLRDDPNLAHGKVAARALESDFGISDEDILNAVSYHTTGRKGMSLLEKIVFLADATEPGRDHDKVEETRRLAYEDLDRACLSALENTIGFLEENGKDIDHDTLDARDDLKEKLGL